MKQFIRNLVVSALSNLSRRTLAKHNPNVVAITGNIGKTTTKDYIYSFLKYKYGDGVRASLKSENSEFGVNLTILGVKNAWGNVFAWLKIIWQSYLDLFKDLPYPKILVLEVGADKPGDISYITSIVKPEMVVLTAFQKSPTHGEFFLNIDQHINEKKVLVDRMEDNGFIVFNYDDKIMRAIAEEKKRECETVQLYSYGTSGEANVIVLENTNLYNEDAEVVGMKTRLGINFPHLVEEIELRLPGIVGDAHTYSIAAAVCICILNGFTKEEIIEASKGLEFAKSRMRLLNGVNKLRIIDDSYNSSPKAAINAIDTVSKILSKGKKIAVLGHMAELGAKTENEHFNIGLLASRFFDSIIVSGKYNEFYLEGIRAGKFDLSKVFLAKDPKEVLSILSDNNLLKPYDLLLVKGSQSARLEKVVVELLENPIDREEVCRQDPEWLKR